MSANLLDGKRVVVVGGGPAGMLAAGHMAKLGAHVDVFERQANSKLGTNEEDDPMAPVRAGWNILLGQRARLSLETAGLSAEFPTEDRCFLPDDADVDMASTVT
jgi:2-polyprenyl-6-methoxyphenol hydroxylase-like FAD-dependent oxidoreductase